MLKDRLCLCKLLMLQAASSEEDTYCLGTVTCIKMIQVCLRAGGRIINFSMSEYNATSELGLHVLKHVDLPHIKFMYAYQDTVCIHI